MSDASPKDLAITFRSLPRRRREAMPDEPSPMASTMERQLDEKVGAAAALMHTTGDANAVADAVEDVRADDWDDATLVSLRALAIEVGRILRELAALSPDQDDD